MDKFDFEDEAGELTPSRLNLLDVFSALAFLATLAISAYVVYVYLNPSTRLNPLYPNIPTAFMFPTPTITPLQQEPTWTPTFVQATETGTLVPTLTLQPSPTLISLVPPTRTPPATARPAAPYAASVQAIDSTIIHPEAGCGWFGVAGSVVDKSGAPVIYMTLRLTGTLDGAPVEKLTVSGTALDYGQSGFEFKLGNSPVASNRLLTLQLLDQAGVPQADPVSMVTYSDCKKNLILIRFKKN
jgi:hypothetical protein